MSRCYRPRGPIPPPLRGAEPGSFAHHTVTVRIPDIGRRALVENAFPPPLVARLEALIEEIPHGRVRSLHRAGAPDEEVWEQYVAPYLGQNWLQVPWFFAETYFYRRVLEATGYFQPGPGQGLDPYAYQKRRGLETSRDAIQNLSEQVNTWLERPAQARDAFCHLLTVDLWGNQADLSLWPADREEKPDHPDQHQARAHVLVDNTDTVANHLFRPDTRVKRVDFVVDNAGFELVCDLCLADFLLSSRVVATVFLHVKAHPTFVSDATAEDVQKTVDFLATQPTADVRALARRLQVHRHQGRLRLCADLFWTSPLSGWEMPPSLWQELARSYLVISKGDANYRRLLGDRHWSFTTPFADILCYFPAPLVALRTFKSEVAAGLRPGQAEEVAQRDPQWMTNGRWGVIQFVDPDSGPAQGVT